MEPNIVTAEAMVRNVANTGAVEVNKTIDIRNQKEKLTSTATVKNLSEAEASQKVVEITSDPNIQKNLVDLVRLCDRTLPNAERAVLINHFSKDLATIQLFQALQAAEPGRFGALGNPADVRYVNELMRNPDFVKAVKEKISGVLDGGKNDNAVEVAGLEKEVLKLQDNLIKKQTEISDNSNRITTLDRELAEYDSKIDPATGYEIGKYAREITDTTNNNALLSAELAQMNIAQQTIDTYLRSIKSFPAGAVINMGTVNETFKDKAEFINWLNGPGYLTFTKELVNKNAEITRNNNRIAQLKEDEIKYKKELEEAKKKEESLPKEEEELESQLEKKAKEYDEKNKLVVDKEKKLSDSINEILRDTYGEMFTNIHTVAGEWQGEHIKTGEQLFEKRLNEKLNARYIDQQANGKIKIKKEDLKEDLRSMKESKPGEAVKDFGIVRINEYINAGMSPAELDFLKTIVEIDPVTNQIKVDPNTGEKVILNEEKFKSLSTKLTGEALAIMVAKDPGMLKDIFSRDDVIARVMAGDVLPTMMEQAIKENKFDKKIGGFDNVTKPDLFKKFCEWAKENKKTFALLLVLLVSGGTIGAFKFLK